MRLSKAYYAVLQRETVFVLRFTEAWGVRRGEKRMREPAEGLAAS